MFTIEGKYAKAHAHAENLDDKSIGQIKNLCDQQFAEGSSIHLMPDAHAGAGCVIGTTMTVTDKIVPNLVGVDISCGVEAVNIGGAEFDPQELDEVIKKKVPSGFNKRRTRHELADEIDLAKLTCANIIELERAALGLGTLGGGNHFIEVDRDENGDYWLVIHSGSRNLGLCVANHHQKLAQEQNPDAPKELAWLEGSRFDDYVHDMKIMQLFAQLNRMAISLEILAGMGWKEKDRFTTVHNYLDTNSMILRKGAVSAQKDQRLLVPLNMRDGSLLCEGLGNPDWNYSAPHGAGRLMSRTEAMRSLDMEEFRNQMAAIYTTTVCKNTLDEAPGAYKPMAEIVNIIGETARIIALLKPVYNFKSTQSNKDWRKKKRQNQMEDTECREPDCL